MTDEQQIHRLIAAHPEKRLRITFSLRKEDGRWLVAHEHHSFPLDVETAAEESTPD